MKTKLTNAALIVFITLMILLFSSCDEFNPLTAAGSGELKIYWVSSNGITGPTIQRSNLDGSGKDDLGITKDYSKVVVDKTNKRLYLVSTSTGSTNQLWYTDLEGQGLTALLSSPSGNAIHDIAIDPLAGKMYFIEGNIGSLTIQRASLNGSGIEDITPTGYDGGPIGSQAIDIDPLEKKMYFVDSAAGSMVRRSNLDGSGVETFITHTDPIYDIAVDPWNQKIYGSADMLTFVSNFLDPNNLSTILSYAVGDLAVDSTSGYIYFTYNDGLDQDIGRITPGMITYDRLVTGLSNPTGIFLDLWP